MKNPVYNITAEKQRQLSDKMKELGIKESDIVERFIRSQGHGGQKVNKTSTCVYLKHLPTGIEVKCQQERSQSLNRYLARRILAGKVEAMITDKESDEQKKIEKLRRQKRRRSRKAKEKVLRLKHLQAEKKKTRSEKPDPFTE